MGPEAVSPINGDLHIALDGAQGPKTERRSRPRAEVHWTIHLFRRGDNHPISSTTRNISSHGFYCLVQQSFQPGECLDCTVVIPTQNSARSDDVLSLQCRARVVRVQPGVADGAIGLACRIEDYHVVHGNRMYASPAEQRYVRHQLGELT